MKKMLLIIGFVLGISISSSAQYLVPLYAPGNSGGMSANTNNIALSVTGQNVIGETSGTNNIAHLGILFPLQVSTNIEISKSGIIQLHQNYPNPYKSKTTIPFEIARAANVHLSLYNVLGQPVEIILDKTMQAGKHYIEYDSENIRPGLYYYQLRVEKYQLTKSMVLTK